MQRNGFTLIELLVTVTIMVIVGVTAVISLTGRRNGSILSSTSQQVGTLLREAQSDSMAQKNSASWGVHFDNTTTTAAWYSLFYTFNATYASSTEMGHYALPAGICYATSSIGSGSTLNIIFSTLSGQPSTSSTITLDLMIGGGCGTGGTAGSATSVVRTSQGEVFFDDFNGRTNL